MSRWKLKEVKPTGTKKSVAVVCTTRGCSFMEPEMPVYPTSIQAAKILSTMKSRMMGLRDGAKRLDMLASTLSGIREGRLVFEDESQFDEALKRLKEW